MRRLGLLLVGALALSPLTAAAPAGAATVTGSASYDCSLSLLGSMTSPVTLSVDLPDMLYAGSTMGPQPVHVSLTIPDAMRAQIATYDVVKVSATSSNASATLGPAALPLGTLTFPMTPMPASGDLVLNGTGTTQAVTLPAPGTYGVGLPATISLAMKGTTSTGTAVATASCNRIGSGTPDGTVTTLPRTASHTTLTWVHRRLQVRVALADGTPADGSLAVKVGRSHRVRHLSSGHTSLRWSHFQRGAHVVVTFTSSSDSVAPSRARLRLR